MKYQRGFNLIDLLIGLAISLFGLLAVGQILLTFTQQRNTITQTLEAQSNGVMALYLLERDLTQAGYGLMTLQDCKWINWYFNGTGYYNDPYGTSTTFRAFTTLPVKITDGGAGASDVLEIQYGNPRSGAPVTVATQTQAAYGTQLDVASTAGFVINDLIVTNVGGSCTMGQIAAPPNAPASFLNRPTTFPYNTDSPPGAATAGWEPAVANTTLVANLGGATGAVAFVSRRYQINDETLQVADYSSVPDPYTYRNLVDGIVFMKAEYGLDTSGNGSINEWRKGLDATNVSALGNQVIAVRIGLVARSPLLEKTAVDFDPDLVVLPAITTTPAAAAVTYTVPDKRYRYRTYYTVIPLRNVIWSR